jgi:ATP-dependent DNA helicase RecG
MKPSLHKLQKFFKLESERGYDNRAVVGGLERVLQHWEAEARSESVPESLVQNVTTQLRNYSSLSPGERFESLQKIWQQLEKNLSRSLPPLKPLQASQPEAPLIQREPHLPPVLRQPSQEQTLINKTARQPSPNSRSAPQPTVEGKSAALNAPVTVLSGVGPRHGQTLARLGLHTLGDLMYYFPRRYDDYSQLKTISRLAHGEETTVIGTLEFVTSRTLRSGRAQVVEALISDGSGTLRLTWFNQPWIIKKLHTGMQVVLSGKVDQYLGRLVMNNPELEPLEQEHLHTNRIVPVYPLTANITQHWLRKLMYDVITYWAPRLRDYLPEAVRVSEELVDLATAILQVHFPNSIAQLKCARYRLAFDEIFFLQLGVLRQKLAWQARTGRIFIAQDDWLNAQVSSLPFTLTQAQQKALRDIQSDLASGHPMNRLLQGDVGSGKTVIAALGTAIVVQSNAQTAIMAPTSILAEQHYKSFARQLCPAPGETQNGSPVLRPEQIALMIGATPEAEKAVIREGLANGTLKVVIGTHALIEDPITFADLQFVVVDEQHRFGVEQRALLRTKGENPHLLVMTATPIPRSLALTVYGDLDLTVMDEMPPGRQPIETQVFYPRERERAYRLIQSQVDQGYQAFIIYPLVEESENSESPAAVEEHARLQREIFPNRRVGLLHGRLRPEEKDAVMAQFRDQEVQILVSTSVVEVGVDIPNATVMMVEGANRFGLAQLHQFRGRVGRGQAQAYCILIPETPDAVENERLSAMVETQNGFILAERDLEQRGPGDFLGTRQAGFQSELRLASLTDVHLIEKARHQAHEIFVQDPKLERSEHLPLLEILHRFWGSTQGDMS